MTAKMKQKLEDMRTAPACTMSPAATLMAERRLQRQAVGSQFICCLCSEVFVTSVSLSQHTTTKHAVPLPCLRCPECAQAFLGVVALEQHRYSKHEQFQPVRVTSAAAAAAAAGVSPAASRAAATPVIVSSPLRSVGALEDENDSEYFTPQVMADASLAISAANYVWPVTGTVLQTLNYDNANPPAAFAQTIGQLVNFQATDPDTPSQWRSLPVHLVADPDNDVTTGMPVFSGNAADMADAVLQTTGVSALAVNPVWSLSPGGTFVSTTKDTPLPVQLTGTLRIHHDDLDYLAAAIATALRVSSLEKRLEDQIEQNKKLVSGTSTPK